MLKFLTFGCVRVHLRDGRVLPLIHGAAGWFPVRSVVLRDGAKGLNHFRLADGVVFLRRCVNFGLFVLRVTGHTYWM